MERILVAGALTAGLFCSAAAHAQVAVTTADGDWGADSPLGNDANFSGDNPLGLTGTAMEVRSDDPSTLRNRLGIIRFDLNGISGDLSNASISLWETGNNSRAVTVYGLLDNDAGEDWSEATITYNTAPAISLGLNPETDAPLTSFDMGRVVELGTFGTTASTLESLSFSSPALDSFLAADTNGQVTFYLYRGGGGTVLFRTKEWAAMSSTDGRHPPTLTLPNATFDATPTWALDDNGVWSDANNWSISVPNAAGAAAIFGPIISDARTVTVDTPVTVGSIRFDNANRYTIEGPSGVTLAGAPGHISVQNGDHTISAALDLQVNTTFNVVPAESTLEVSNLSATSFNITKSGDGVLEVNRIASNGLTISAGKVRTQTDGGTSMVSAISIASGASLDLANNELRVQNGNITAVNALVSSGYAGGAWNGSGINSSAAVAAADQSLGVAQDGSEVVVKLTFAGDATLDGAVTIADLGVLAANWQGTERLWSHGDFNYDGNVTIADLGILAANWQKGVSGGASMSFEEALALFDVFNGVVVPEPAALSMLGLAGVSLLGRRRRR